MLAVFQSWVQGRCAGMDGVPLSVCKTGRGPGPPAGEQSS